MDDLAIAVVLWDGVEELDFAGPYEVLTASPERARSVRRYIQYDPQPPV